MIQGIASGIRPPASTDKPHLRIGMMSADSGASKRGVEGEHARGQDEQAEGQAGIDAGLDEWERIVGELEEDDEQPRKRVRREEPGEPAETAEEERGQSMHAESVDDTGLEGEHGELRPGAVRAPVQPTKQEIDEHYMTHLPFRDWCPVCVAARAKEGVATLALLLS